MMDSSKSPAASTSNINRSNLNNGSSHSASFKSNNSSSNSHQSLIFSSPSEAQYLVFVFPICMLLTDFVTSTMLHGEEPHGIGHYLRDMVYAEEHHTYALRSGFRWFYLFLTAVILLIFPLRYRLHSNGLLEVDGVFRTFKFDQIESARRDASCLETFRKFRWDFASTISNRVIIKRKSIGKFGDRVEICCSPADPDGLVEAIQKLVQADDDDDDGTMRGP